MWILVIDILRAALHAIVCRHPHRYRERRTLHGVLVPHLVCADCGKAEPMLRRTPAEHVEAARRGAIVPFPVTRHQRSTVVGPWRRSG